MWRVLSVGAAVGLSGIAGIAHGDENSGLYLGAGFGDYSSEIQDVGDVDIDFDDDSDASKLFAGWRFNRFLALELNYIDFGDTNVGIDALEIGTDTTGLAPYLVGTLPLGPIELFAKAGVLFYDIEVTLDGAELIDERDQDVVYGAGIGLTLLGRLALRAEYEVVEISEVDDAEAVWLTAAWRF